MSVAAFTSKPFKLAQWKEYIIPEEDDRKWRHPEYTRISGTPPKEVEKVANSWVYVYQRLGQQTGGLLLMEIFVDGQGTMHILPTSSSDFALDPLNRPAPDKLPQVATLRLEHTVNGRDAFYYFYISRIRVSSTILTTPSHLEVKTTELLPEVNFKDLTNYVPIDGQDYVVGLDPVVVGLNLQAKYEVARDRYLSYTIPSPDNPDTDCQTRLWKKLLAETIVGVMDNNPAVKKLLEPEFLGTLTIGPSLGESQMRDCIKDYNAIVKARIDNYNDAAKELCFWLSGRLMYGAKGAVEMAHFEHEDTDFPGYIEVWDKLTERLQESDAGKVFLAKVLQDRTHWIHDYVLVSKSPTPARVKSIAGKLGTILGLWEKLGTVGIMIPGWLPANEKVAQRLVISLQFITRKPVMAETVVTKTEIKLVHRPTFDQRVTSTQIKMGVDLDSLELRNKLAAVLELVNLALAIQAYQEANGGIERMQAIASGFKSLVKIVIVGVAFRRLLSLPLKKAGAVAAVVDVVCSSAAAVDSWTKGQYIVAIGTGISAVGSVLIAYGAVATLVGASAGPAATVGLVITIVGAVLVWWGSDHELQTFVAHCVWGKSYGSGVDRPAWAGGTVADFKDNYLRQNEALLNLLADFTLEADRRGKQAIVRILMNRVDALSVFRVNIEALFLEFPDSMTRRERTDNQQVFINCGDQTISLPGSTARTPITFGNRNGQQFVEIFSSVDAPADWMVGPDGLQFMRAAVYLDYFGNQERFVPGVPDGALPPPPPKHVGIELFPRPDDPQHSRDVKV